MKKITLSLLLFAGCFSFAGTLAAQISVSTSGQDVQIGKDGSVKARSDNATNSSSRKNDASVTVGGIADGANIEGITIINDRVSIDGKDVPPNVTRYKSPKTGK
ncbi:MAG: hypothetical protein WCL27_16120, partial [Betaproteobacteria bacterium]